MKDRIRNLLLLVKILWMFDRKIYFYFSLSSVLFSVEPYFNILIPRYVIKGILENSHALFWQQIFVVGLLSVVISALAIVFYHLFERRINISRNECFGEMLDQKMTRISYEYLENPGIQDKYYRAKSLFWSEFGGMMGIFKSMRTIVSCLISLAGIIIILSKLQRFISLYLMTTVIIDMLLLFFAKQKEEKLHEKENKEARKIEYIFNQMTSLEAGKDIRLFSLNDGLITWYKNTFQILYRIKNKIRNYYKRSNIAINWIEMTADLLVFGLLIKGIFNQQIGIDIAVMLSAAVVSFTFLLKEIITNILNIRQFITRSSDYYDLMKMNEEEKEEPIITSKRIGEIEMHEISYSYNTEFQLKSINLNIKNGEHISIVGRNGSGKTTLIKILLGLYKPASGEYRIKYMDGSNMKWNMNHYTTAVMQRVFQYAMTVDENATFHEYPEIDKMKISAVYQDSGFQKHVGKMPQKGHTLLCKDYDDNAIDLSSGQLQELAISRALYKDAQVIILDEPSSAMDPVSERRLYDKFAAIFKDKTCIFVSHRLWSVKNSDRIYMMSEGRIIAVGKHEELLSTCNEYKEMWEAQKEYHKGSE